MYTLRFGALVDWLWAASASSTQSDDSLRFERENVACAWVYIYIYIWWRKIIVFHLAFNLAPSTHLPSAPRSPKRVGRSSVPLFSAACNDIWYVFGIDDDLSRIMLEWCGRKGIIEWRAENAIQNIFFLFGIFKFGVAWSLLCEMIFEGFGVFSNNVPPNKHWYIYWNSSW